MKMLSVKDDLDEPETLRACAQAMFAATRTEPAVLRQRDDDDDDDDDDGGSSIDRDTTSRAKQKRT
jgi:hypothetical protein